MRLLEPKFLNRQVYVEFYLLYLKWLVLDIFAIKLCYSKTEGCLNFNNLFYVVGIKL